MPDNDPPDQGGTRPEGWDGLPLTDAHAAFLAAHAVPADVARRLGVRSLTGEPEIRGVAGGAHAWAGGRALPAIAFPWRRPGRAGDPPVIQLRPDTPVAVAGERETRKYLWPAGSGSVVGAVVEDSAGPVLFVEGTKQSLAAAGCVGEGTDLGPASVYAVAGCRSWSTEGVPLDDLHVVEGRDVVLLFDADVATNPDVWDAADRFAAALLAEGATAVRHVLLPAGAKAGLDDVLAGRPPERRGTYLARLVAQAVTKLPRRPKRAPKTVTAPPEDPDRPVVAVNEDRRTVIDGITAALRRRWDGTELFDFGGAVTRRTGAELHPLTGPQFADLLATAALTAATGPNGELVPAWPDAQSLASALSRHQAYAPLERVTEVPFIRSDGTVRQEAGYDEATRTYLVEGLGVAVPEEPTAEEVAAARELLLGEWLGDLVRSMPGEADRANALALVLTPLVRGLVPLAPMCVVNGLQMGVGKNLLADVVSIFHRGRPADPLPYNAADEENRKVVTASFREGASLMVFDEAHRIEGAALARSITALNYRDRILGVSATLSFPNRVTWVALGNNVQINGDMSRRVYVVRLAPPEADPQDRSADSFRHPDLKGWTAEHRAELVSAGLTLVRAWFVAGRPATGPGAVAGRRLGSFEPWGGLVGGVLDHAGVSGFLGNLAQWRSETDYERAYWLAHLEWLESAFGEGTPFTVAEVVRAMTRAAERVEHPPGRELADHTAPGYGRRLGQAYGGQKDKGIGGLRLSLVSASAKHGNRWAVRRYEHGPGAEAEAAAVKADLPTDIHTEWSRYTGRSYERGAEGSEKGFESPIDRGEDTSQVETTDPFAPYQDHSEGFGGVMGIFQPRNHENLISIYDNKWSGSNIDTRILPLEGEASPPPPTIPRPGSPSWRAAGRAWDEALASAVETLLDAVDPGVAPYRPDPCPDCDGELRAVPPVMLWYACPACAPASFTR